MQTLGMNEHAKMVLVCPSKPNITFSVAKFTSFDSVFGSICVQLREQHLHGRVLIFCQKIADCSDRYVCRHQETRTREFPIGINYIVFLYLNCATKHYLMTVDSCVCC